MGTFWIIFYSFPLYFVWSRSVPPLIVLSSLRQFTLGGSLRRWKGRTLHITESKLSFFWWLFRVVYRLLSFWIKGKSCALRITLSFILTFNFWWLVSKERLCHIIVRTIPMITLPSFDSLGWKMTKLCLFITSYELFGQLYWIIQTVCTEMSWTMTSLYFFASTMSSSARFL